LHLLQLALLLQSLEGQWYRLDAAESVLIGMTKQGAVAVQDLKADRR